MQLPPDVTHTHKWACEEAAGERTILICEVFQLCHRGGSSGNESKEGLHSCGAGILMACFECAGLHSLTVGNAGRGRR